MCTGVLKRRNCLTLHVDICLGLFLYIAMLCVMQTDTIALEMPLEGKKYNLVFRSNCIVDLWFQ